MRGPSRPTANSADPTLEQWHGGLFETPEVPPRGGSGSADWEPSPSASLPFPSLPAVVVCPAPPDGTPAVSDGPPAVSERSFCCGASASAEPAARPLFAGFTRPEENQGSSKLSGLFLSLSGPGAPVGSPFVAGPEAEVWRGGSAFKCIGWLPSARGGPPGSSPSATPSGSAHTLLLPPIVCVPASATGWLPTSLRELLARSAKPGDEVAA